MYNSSKVISKEFKSINEFVRYLKETPTNSVFNGRTLSSKNTDSIAKMFTQTDSFDEAVNMITNGWDEMAKKMEKQFQLINKELGNKIVQRAQFDVVGFQASVPRYLQGIPTNMINKKNIVQKQKVITIVKHIGYLGNVQTNEILENSMKALQIVKAIEDKGIRVNLDVISPAKCGNETVVCRVRVKTANERMNISKVAFPMMHPSMLRRLVFRFREVNPEIKEFGWVGSYGITIYDRKEVKALLKPNEYYLHNFIETVEEELNNMVRLK